MNFLSTNPLSPAVIFLASFILLGASIAACGGDDDGGDASATTSPADGSPSASPMTPPPRTPGVGSSPVEAIGTYLLAGEAEGIVFDANAPADCTVEDIPEDVDATTIASLGQFCFVAKSFEPIESMTGLLFEPETGERWEVEIVFEENLWRVEDFGPE